MRVHRRIDVLITLFISLLALANIASARTLTILNWEEYLSQDIIKAWEEKTGHTLKQIYYDSDEDRDVILSRGAKGIDLVVTDETSVFTFGQNQTLLPLNEYINTPNLKLVDEEWQNRCGEHAIAYLWGTLGVVYRTDIFKKPPTSWEVIVKPEPPAKMHIGLIEDYADMLAPALFYGGHEFNTQDKAVLKNAFETFKGAMPYVLTMDYSISYVEDKIAKNDLYLALAYSGDQHILNDKAGQPLWEYTTLKEGTAAWGDCFSVVKSSANTDLAFDFLNFLYLPKNAALNSEDLGVAVPMKAARALQSEEFLSDESVYPPESILKKMQFYKLLSPDNIILRNRITNSLVKIYESQ